LFLYGLNRFLFFCEFRRWWFWRPWRTVSHAVRKRNYVTRQRNRLLIYFFHHQPHSNGHKLGLYLF